MAAGGAVTRNAYGPEIGWAPIQLDPACQDDRAPHRPPPTLTVLHWHGETASTCRRAARPLISSTAYPNQAFRLGDVAWGVQFHLEVDRGSGRRIRRGLRGGCGDVPGGAEAIRAATPARPDAPATARDSSCARFADSWRPV